MKAKNCSTCKESKPLSEFNPRKWGKRTNGYHSKCRHCQNTQRRAKHNFEENRNELLKARFGIDLDQYNQMFTAQSGGCAICKKPQSAQARALSVDHDHKTGAIRGLLCENCNRALGQFQDNTEILKSAITYLSKEQHNLVVIPLTVKHKRYRRDL